MTKEDTAWRALSFALLIVFTFRQAYAWTAFYALMLWWGLIVKPSRELRQSAQENN